MPWFCTKRKIVQAQQYKKGQPLPQGVQYDKCIAIPTPPFVVTIHNQRVYLEDGDWILPEPDGKHYYPVKDAIFQDRYELVGPDIRTGKPGCEVCGGAGTHYPKDTEGNTWTRMCDCQREIREENAPLTSEQTRAGAAARQQETERHNQAALAGLQKINEALRQGLDSPLVRMADVDNLIISAIEETDLSLASGGEQDPVWDKVYAALKQLREQNPAKSNTGGP